jgi:GrpB-like predicted nucleotidyltransferase (UPF0157 family)
MRLRPEQSTRDEIERLFASRRGEIIELIPEAEVEHIGATSVPGSLTKGDLDLLVSVAGERFVMAAATLKSRFAVNQPEIWSDTYASFEEKPAGPIAVGVQLVATGSLAEEVFIRWRDLLTADPHLLRRYNELKQAHADGDHDHYIAEKGRFIESQGLSFDRS